MGAGVDHGRPIVASSKQVEGVSGGGPILCELKAADEGDDVKEICGGLQLSQSALLLSSEVITQPQSIFGACILNAGTI